MLGQEVSSPAKPIQEKPARCFEGKTVFPIQGRVKLLAYLGKLKLKCHANPQSRDVLYLRGSKALRGARELHGVLGKVEAVTSAGCRERTRYRRRLTLVILCERTEDQCDGPTWC